MSSDRPLVLVVAGLDSGGGAGGSADCITVYDNGAFALPAITALTVQSLKEVAGLENASDKVFRDTLELAVRDWPRISAVKVGLVCAKSHLDILLDFLANRLKGVPVVWDPVLTATAGRLDSADLKAQLDDILPLVTVFTPNLPEALELASWSEEDLEKRGVRELAGFFLGKGAKSVIIKGGHRADAEHAEDRFACDGLFFTMSYPKKKGDGAHGGGCALSSAIAALLANNYAPFDAAVLAKAYVTQGIYEPAVNSDDYRPPIGHNGFVQDIKYCPRIIQEGFPGKNYGFGKTVAQMGLYPVVADNEWLERLLKLGVKTIQLRIKDKDDPDLYGKIEKGVELGKKYQARVFIDDHYDLAIRAKAYGVHLGMEDLMEADLQKIKDAGLALGVSTHGPFEMLKAYQLDPSYIALGHIFPTQSKQMPSKPQGVGHLAAQVRLLKGRVPMTAIGGIKYDRLGDVMDTGVGSAAVITALTDIKDQGELEKTVASWLARAGSGGAQSY